MATVHRSFRLSAATGARLDERAAELRTTRSELAERLLDEALRHERHPQVSFRWVDGERRPFVGEIEVVRLLVALRANHGDIGKTATLLRVEQPAIELALAYYDSYRAETDLLVRRTIKRIGHARGAADRRQELLRGMAGAGASAD